MRNSKTLYMKKLLIAAAVLLLSVSCMQKETSKILVLYYSQGGTTKGVAEQIQSLLGADIEAIEPVVPYDGDFPATIERGRKELMEGPLPAIHEIKADVKAYDVIFLGFPVWFGTYATPVAAALDSLDLSGKKVVPFCTFGSGGLDSSSKALKNEFPDAEILPGYGVRAARIDAVPRELDRFLKESGFIEGEIEPIEDFPALHAVSEEEAGIFDAAVGDYPMINAKAVSVASRILPEGTEYVFSAADQPREPEAAPREITVYVLAETGKAPVFTQVLR